MDEFVIKNGENGRFAGLFNLYEVKLESGMSHVLFLWQIGTPISILLFLTFQLFHILGFF